MKLELLVSQSGQTPSSRELNADDPPLIVQSLWAPQASQKLDRALLEALERSLHRDILRARQIKRKIDEPFLESCFAKWRHSLGETEWEEHADKLSLFVFVGPALCGKKGDFFAAIWGDASLIQREKASWSLAPPTSTSQSEAGGAYYRYRHCRNVLFLALYPSSISSKQLKNLPADGDSLFGQYDSRAAQVEKLRGKLGPERSWCLLRAMHLSRWSFSSLWQKGGHLAQRCLRRLRSLPLSQKKITTIATGILLSILCTSFLLIYTKRTKAVSPSQPSSEAAPRAPDVSSYWKARERSLVNKRFQPYSAWISWLQPPSDQGEYGRGKGANSSVFSADESAAPKSDFGAGRGRIEPSESLSLQVLEEEIQRDLANLQRHQETLAQIAKSQGSASSVEKIPSLRWFEEEQKRSEQHLLMARSSLEKLSRRYGELSSLSTIEPTLPIESPSPVSPEGDCGDTRADRAQGSAPATGQMAKTALQIRYIPLASLTMLRQRLHFPLANWELSIIDRWIEQFTGWKSADERRPL